MGQNEIGEQPSLLRAANLNAQDQALNGAAILFDQNQLKRGALPAGEGVAQAQTGGSNFQPNAGNLRSGLRERMQIQATQNPPGDVGQWVPADQANRKTTLVQNIRDRVPIQQNDLPGYKYVPPTPSQQSLLESTSVKQTDLNAPHVSKTSDQANSLFEKAAALGSSAFFVNRDFKREMAVAEAQIAKTPLVSTTMTHNFNLTRESLLNAMRTPIQQGEAAMEVLAGKYPRDYFNAESVTKLNNKGRLLMPQAWDLEKFSVADRAVAERFMEINKLRENLTMHWPPQPSVTLGRLPHNVANMPIIKAEGLVAQAAKFDAAGVAWTGEVANTLNASSALRNSVHTHAFKSAGALGAAFVTNIATDAVIQTKHGPSNVVWAADLISPAILLTKQGMLTKYAVVAGAHAVAKLYDKFTEKP